MRQFWKRICAIKTWLLMVILVIGSTTKGWPQVSIGSSDMPVVNDTIRISTGTLDSTAPPLDHKGAGVVWDYSGLNPISQRLDTIFSVSATPLAYQSQFNSPFDPDYQADHAVRQPSQQGDSSISPIQFEDVYEYYKNTGSQYQLVGFGAKVNGIPTSTKYDPKDTIYDLDLNFGDTDSSYAKFVYDQVPDFYYQQERWREDTVDGYGTLHTPFGTFQVLRVRSHLTFRDSIKSDSLGIDTAYYRPERVEYKWLGKGEGLPLLKITTRASLVNRVEYQDSARSTLLSVEEGFSKTDPALYPNPTNGRVRLEGFQTSGEYRMLIHDMRGRLRRSMRRDMDPGEVLKLDLGSLKGGIYSVQVLDEKGRGFLMKKLVVR